MTNSTPGAPEQNPGPPSELGKGPAEYRALKPEGVSSSPREHHDETTVTPTLETAREAVIAAAPSAEIDVPSDNTTLLPFPTEFFEFDKRKIKKEFSNSLGKRIATRLAIIWHDDDDDRAPNHQGSKDIRFHELRNRLSDALDGGPEKAMLESLTGLLRPSEAETAKTFPDEFFDQTLRLAQNYAANPPKDFKDVLRNPEAAFRYAQMGALMQTPAFWADERSQGTLETLAALPEGTEIPHPHYAEFKQSDYGPQIQWRAKVDDIPGIARVVQQDSLWQGNPEFAKNFFGPLASLLTESPLAKSDRATSIRSAMMKRARENQQPTIERTINTFR